MRYFEKSTCETGIFYNLTAANKIGCLQCASFIEARPFTGDEAML